MFQKINPVLRHGINSEQEVRAAEEAKKESDAVNGEIKDTQDENESENKESIEKDTVDNSEKDDNAENNAKTCATESPNANNDSSCNDNNSNNRTIGEEPETSACIVETKSESGEQTSDDKKYVVSEQSEDAAKDTLITPEDKCSTERTEQSCSSEGDVKPSPSDMSSTTSKCVGNGSSSVSNISSVESTDGAQGVSARDESCENQETPASVSDTTKTQVDIDQQVKIEYSGEEAMSDVKIIEGSEQQTSQPDSGLLSSPTAHHAPTVICWSPPRPSTPLPEREEVMPNVEEFELICDSVESLRALVKKFSGEPEEIIIPAKGKKKQKVSY